MAAPNPRLADLSDDERQGVESWLIDFDQRWDEGILAGRVNQIPPGSSWRLPALVEMVKIDLERQWQHGRRVSLESYLQQFPELGRPENISADLIQAEYEVRREYGAPAALEDYILRFPHQAGELARLIDGGDSSSRANKPRGTSPRLPETFGRYTIIKRLGQGGMGSVYLAQDLQLERPVALKIPDFGPHEGPEARKRFLEEARTAAMLDHPYLCPMYDAEETDGPPYLTMAYIEGQSLEALIGASGWPARSGAALVGKLALAMQEAHAKKVVHCDLKPANIMIRTTGPRREPVIIDFGLAYHDDPESVRLSRSGELLGTLGYMAPEQVRGELDAIGPACDIYALGVILYEMLTGRLPFGGSGLAVAGQILAETPLPPSAHRGDLDPAVEAICLKAMAKQAGDRYASMGELAAALAGFLGSPAATPIPAPRPLPGGRRPRAPRVVATAGLGVLLLGVVARFREGEAPSEPIPVPARTEPRPRGIKQSHSEPILNSIGMKLVRIPAGAFTMGMSPEATRDLRKVVEGRADVGWFDRQFRSAPQHHVILTKPWLMGVTEVTVGHFRRFVEATGYVTEAEQYGGGNSSATTIDPTIPDAKNSMTWRTPGYAVADDSPVTQVSWNDAVAFCNWLSEQAKLTPCYERGAGDGWSVLATGQGYRLPTEAEWEYACQAGSTDEPASADGFAWLEQRAWYAKNRNGGPQPVAGKLPNGFGLHDTRGNVMEWCQDWYGADDYLQSLPNDPTGPSSGDLRVQRGGGWNYDAVHCHSGFRTFSPPSGRIDHRGFRVVRVTTEALSAGGGARGVLSTRGASDHRESQPE